MARPAHLLLLMLLLGQDARARAPASRPASAPASQPASAPASRPVGPGAPAVETIADPEDEDDWVPPAPEPAARTSVAAGTVEPPTTLSLRGQLQLALDTWHEGSAGGLREDVMDLTGQAVASLDHRARPWLSLRVAGRLLYRLTARRPDGQSYYLFNGDVHRDDWEADLLDTHVVLRPLRWLDVTAGLVTQVWGVNDLVNPNDVLAPRDLRFGVFLDAETARLPTAMVRTEVYLPRGLSVAGYLMPVHSPDRIDLFGSDFALLGPAAPESLRWLGQMADGVLDDSVEAAARDALLATERPRPFADPALGLRAGWRAAGWDLFLCYAWLHQRQPRIRLEQDMVLGLLPLFASAGGELTPQQREQLGGMLVQDPLPIHSGFPRQHHAGLGVSGSVWQLALKLDVAYRDRVAVPLGGALPLQPDPDAAGWLTPVADSQLLAWTAGLSYTRGEELLLTLEGWHEVYLDLVGDDDRPELLLGQPQQGGLAFLGRYRLFQPVDLALQLLVHADLINRGVIITPRLTWRPGDHLGLTLGANLFEGSQDSLAGRLDPNDQLYLGVEGFL